MKSRGLRILSFLVSIAVLAVLALGLLYRQNIYDWWRLREYDPPAAIEKLAANTTMTEEGRRIFYVTHPQLSDRETFRQQCPNLTEQTIILGCYVSPFGIYIFDVKDKRLQGVEEVTAAHEMLHAAYDRLDSAEKESINAQLEQAYKSVSNKRIRSAIDTYRENGADVANELHSILPTEVRNLPKGLEEYYARYFRDRSRIVDYSERYENEFNSRQNRVAQLDLQLEALKLEIESNQQELDQQFSDLQSRQQELARLLAEGRVEERNALVDSYNQDVNNYNALAQETERLITQYNTLVSERNDIALEVQSLTKAIDSRPQSL